MSAPEENLDVAVDGSRDPADRERAIDALHTANECEKLSEVVRREDLDSRYRERAVEALADPQCKTSLRQLLDDEDLPAGVRDDAERLFRETPDHTGAGP